MITVFNKRLSLFLLEHDPSPKCDETVPVFSFDQARGHFHSPSSYLDSSECRGVALCGSQIVHHTLLLLNWYKNDWEVALSSGLGANPTKHSPSVSAMNPPLQVGLTFLLMSCIALTMKIQVSSRVMWWDTRGQLKYGKVKAFHALNDVRQIYTRPILI